MGADLVRAITDPRVQELTSIRQSSSRPCAA
jgi:hypothetical protein